MEPVRVTRPRIETLITNNTLSQCVVMTSHVHLVTCNMTVRTGKGQLIALTVNQLSIPVPGYIWESGVSDVICEAGCVIKGGSGRVQNTSAEYKVDVPGGEVSTTSLLSLNSDKMTVYFVTICVLSVGIVVLTMITTYLIIKSSYLTKKLSNCYHPPPRPTSATNSTCHNYNTVCLQLRENQQSSYCDRISLNKTAASPHYQRLYKSYNREQTV